MKKIVPLLIVIIIFSLSSTAQHGALDTAFNHSGFVLTNVSGKNSSYGYDVAIDRAGKTLVSGKVNIAPTLTEAVLMRYKLNGDLDSNFGTNGTVLESFSNSFDNFSALALQPDGKIVVTGLSIRNDSFFVLFARYNANGTLDRTFRTKKTALKYYGFGAVGCMVLVQPDKKILLLLNNNEPVTNKAQTQVERYNEDGTPDKTFANNGNFTYTGDFWFTKFTIDNQNRVICLSGDAGFTSLLRLKNNGKPDNSFGTNGLITTRVSPYDGSDNLVVQPNGKIVVCGFLQSANFVDDLFSVYRFNANGTLDSSFNDTGINSTRITGLDFTYDVSLQPSGRIIAVGYSITPKKTYITLMRYNSNGKTDSTWGNNGVDTVDATWKLKHYSYAVASAVSADGATIAVTGNQTGRNFSQNAFLTARFLVHGTDDIAAVTSSGVQVIKKDEHVLVYPNPAHTTATISFSLQQNSKINVRLINTKGEVVSTVYSGSMDKGDHQLNLNISQLPAGLYTVVLQTGNQINSIKLLKF
ncbi:MAG TPA: T9SS type A sorting domain-containing protein [Parafilimonas sp.]|nr:T9SS type A sorting domain-containing protein [Parafilimonas sp.]